MSKYPPPDELVPAEDVDHSDASARGLAVAMLGGVFVAVTLYFAFFTESAPPEPMRGEYGACGAEGKLFEAAP